MDESSENEAYESEDILSVSETTEVSYDLSDSIIDNDETSNLEPLETYLNYRNSASFL